MTIADEIFTLETEHKTAVVLAASPDEQVRLIYLYSGVPIQVLELRESWLFRVLGSGIETLIISCVRAGNVPDSLKGIFLQDLRGTTENWEALESTLEAEPHNGVLRTHVGSKIESAMAVLEAYLAHNDPQHYVTISEPEPINDDQESLPEWLIPAESLSYFGHREEEAGLVEEEFDLAWAVDNSIDTSEPLLFDKELEEALRERGVDEATIEEILQPPVVSGAFEDSEEDDRLWWPPSAAAGHFRRWVGGIDLALFERRRWTASIAINLMAKTRRKASLARRVSGQFRTLIVDVGDSLGRMRSIWKPDYTVAQLDEFWEKQRQHDEASKAVRRSLLVVIGFSFFAALAVSLPDADLITAASEVVLPFASLKVDLGTFLVMGPLLLLALDLQLQLFVTQHFQSDPPIVELRLPMIFNLPNIVARVISQVLFYWLVPVVIWYFFWRTLHRPEAWFLFYLLVLVLLPHLFIQIRRCPESLRGTVNPLLWLGIFLVLLVSVDKTIVISRGGYISDCALVDTRHSISWLLRGPFVRQLELFGSDFAGRNLSRLNLYRADLRKSDLSGADLSWTNLEGARLTDAQLEGANVTCSLVDPKQLAGKGTVGSAGPCS